MTSTEANGSIQPKLVLIKANDVAGLLGVSTRTLWRLLSEGRLPQPIRSTQPAAPLETCETKEACDRCGGEVYRMHAVWRCIKCGFKSDCCGW